MTFTPFDIAIIATYLILSPVFELNRAIEKEQRKLNANLTRIYKDIEKE